MSTPIDIVITWVDGSDPKLSAKRLKYTDRRTHISEYKDIAAPTRYSSLGEIYWCIKSIQRFAPFVNRIYIVTDGQDPHVEQHVPELSIPVTIIDHSVIFKDYEEYLPVFNSLAIETMLWRIPGLSENFAYLNDDFFLVAPVSPSDWFDKKGRPKLYGYEYGILKARIFRLLNYAVKRRKVVKFRDTMLEAALLPEVNSGRFIRLQHLPLSMKKSLYQEYYAKHPETIIQNIRHRFRDVSQYNPQELNYLLSQKRYGLSPLDPKRILVTMGPSGDHRFRRRFRNLTTSPSVSYLCVNSMDLMTDSQRKAVEEYLMGCLDHL